MANVPPAGAPGEPKPFSLEWSIQYFEAAEKQGLRTPAHRCGSVILAELKQLRAAAPSGAAPAASEPHWPELSADQSEVRVACSCGWVGTSGEFGTPAITLWWQHVGSALRGAAPAGDTSEELNQWRGMAQSARREAMEWQARAEKAEGAPAGDELLEARAEGYEAAVIAERRVQKFRGDVLREAAQRVLDANDGYAGDQESADEFAGAMDALREALARQGTPWKEGE